MVSREEMLDWAVGVLGGASGSIKPTLEYGLDDFIARCWAQQIIIQAQRMVGAERDMLRLLKNYGKNEELRRDEAGTSPELRDLSTDAGAELLAQAQCVEG